MDSQHTAGGIFAFGIEEGKSPSNIQYIEFDAPDNQGDGDDKKIEEENMKIEPVEEVVEIPDI